MSLSDDQKRVAQDQYFNTAVAPKVPSDDIDIARGQFNNHVKKLGIRKEEPTYLENVLSNASRLLGVGIGAVNSPLAYVWGSQQAQHIDPEGYGKLPLHKRVLVDIGGGLESAWRSAAKKGDWRTNVSRGGKASKIIVPKEIKEAAVKTSKILGLDLCGVDFIKSKGAYWIIEVNMTPGIMPDYFRGQLAEKFINFIYKRAKRYKITGS